MPLYEYQCPECGTFERVQKFSDPILTGCPTCGKPVEKLLSAPAIQFKGAGWYVTDYANKGSGGEKPSGEAKTKAGGDGDGGKDKSSSKDSSAKKDSSKSTSSKGTPSK